MAVTISKLAVVMEGSVGGLVSSLHAGERAVTGFEHTVEHVGGHVTEMLAALGVGLSIEGVTEYLHHTMEAIDANAKLSDSLGVSTESLGRMQYAASLAGVSNEQLQTGLTKMLKSLNEAQGGTGPAADAFRQLGLNANELVNMKPEDAIGKIGDKLKEITNPAQRAGATMEIFGKSGATLLPLLTKGSEGLAKMGEEADKFGLAMTRTDSAKMEMANDAITKVESALQGAANQLVVHMAPYIQAVADKLVSLGTDGEGMAKVMVNGFESVVKGVAYATDFLNAFAAGWELLRGVTAAVIGELIDDIGYVIQGIEWLSNKLLGTNSHMGDSFRQFGQAVMDVGEDAFKKAGEDWDKFIAGDNSKKAGQFFRNLEEASQHAAEQIAADKSKMGGAFDDLGESAKHIEEATKKLDALRKQVDEFGKSKGQIAADDVAAIGGTAAQQAEAKSLAERLDQLEEMKKAQEAMAQDAGKMWEETRTPAEKYANELDKINTLLAEGKIDEETADRARQKAAADLDKSGEGKKAEGPKLLEAGSQEVAKFVAEVQQRQRDAKHQDELVAEAKKQTDLQRKMAEALGGGGEENEFTAVNIV